jgi:predicted molibdopterin-dependent oxidoreductase YjgC
MIANPSDAGHDTLTLDGQEVPFTPGETIYEIAQRHRKEIPTLCYDERLEPFGGCRLCAVELEGSRLPVASCTTRAEHGMVIRTTTAVLEKHRKTLLEMVASENREIDVDGLRGYASQELTALLGRYAARKGRFAGAQSGHSRADDDNPFILRDYDLCISCYRCVRVCAEQEGDHAISVMNRGFGTQITTEFAGLLRESACTFCGQCVHTCPTGALADRKALRFADMPGTIEQTRTICPYCGVGCSVDVLTKDNTLVGVRPAMDGPANLGALCIKGQFAWDFVQHADRLAAPLVRGDDGELHETDWDTALDRAADGFRRVVAEHGRDSIYAVASGRAPNEAAYTVQKFVRAGWGVNGVDNCSRA